MGRFASVEERRRFDSLRGASGTGLAFRSLKDGKGDVVKIVVMGGSAGAIPSLLTIFEGLVGFPAPLLVAVHMAPDSRSVLPRLLEYASHLPAHHVRGESRLEAGHVYVPPPNWHLELTKDAVITTLKPKEHFSRPSLDVLFRSAAKSYGPDVIAVLLSGYLSDGGDGVKAVKDHGGTVIVQDPNDTPYSDMPRHALSKVKADYVLSLFEIAPTLRRLVMRDPSLRSG